MLLAFGILYVGNQKHHSQPAHENNIILKHQATSWNMCVSFCLLSVTFSLSSQLSLTPFPFFLLFPVLFSLVHCPKMPVFSCFCMMNRSVLTYAGWVISNSCIPRQTKARWSSAEFPQVFLCLSVGFFKFDKTLLKGRELGWTRRDVSVKERVRDRLSLCPN